MANEFINHRSLVDEVQTLEDQRAGEMDQLQGQINGLQKQYSVFKHEGWQAVQSRLYEELNLAYHRLKGDTITSMEGVARLRGEIAALEKLMVLDEAIKMELDLARDRMKVLQSGMSGSP